MAIVNPRCLWGGSCKKRSPPHPHRPWEEEDGYGHAARERAGAQVQAAGGARAQADAGVRRRFFTTSYVLHLRIRLGPKAYFEKIIKGGVIYSGVCKKNATFSFHMVAFVAGALSRRHLPLVC